jgi:toxin ParE1/3/4
MSFRKPLAITLAPRARQDLIDILRYTGETWGQAQLLTYRDKINDAFLAISANPQLGHLHGDLPTTHLAYLVGSHIIVYRVGADNIGFVRILHQRMSHARHL